MKVKYKIYQPTIGSGRVLKPLCATTLGDGDLVFDFDYYNQVYVGELNVADDNPIDNTLEKIYNIFNRELTNGYGYPDFKGHSLSVGDIVSINNGYYYCDIQGWSYDIAKECGF